MKIELREISVRKLADGFADNAEQGVVAYGGKLDIRPPYQREFIYKDKQRDAVIESLRKDFPLNVMYWALRDDGSYEVIDGQQRTLSISQYVNGDYSIKGLAFHNLKDDQQQQILDYKLMVYFCSGTDSEKLDWFRTINIAGEEHTDQELRNAVYAGPWTADAKRYFSKTGCAAYGLASDYMRGSPIRQEYLETAISWRSDGEIEQYMSSVKLVLLCRLSGAEASVQRLAFLRPLACLNVQPTRRHVFSYVRRVGLLSENQAVSRIKE